MNLKHFPLGLGIHTLGFQANICVSSIMRTAVFKPFEAQWIMTMKTSAIQNYHLRKLFESATPRLRLISVMAGRDEWSMNEKGFLHFVKRNFVQERRCHYTQAVYIVYVAVIVFSTCIYIYIQNILKTKQSLSLVLRLPQTGFNSDTIWIIHCRIFQKPFDVMQHNKQL